MPKPWTFGLLKPDALANPISLTWILDAIHRKGLVIREGCRLMLTMENATQLYSAHKYSFFYSRLIRHVCSGPIVAMRLEFVGFNEAEIEGNRQDEELAIKLWRELLGPSKLFPNIYSIECKELDEMRLRNCRQQFALSDTRNFAHGSDSLDETKREYSIFKHLMRKIEDPYSELFHLHKFNFEDDGNGNDDDDGINCWNILHE